MTASVAEPRPPSLTPTIDSRGRILCCHRARLYPQSIPNSLAAVAECVAARAPRIEIDVRFTSDGVPVVWHDATLEHPALGMVNVAALELADLADIRIDGSGEPIPMLAELVDQTRGTDTRLQVDLKPLAPLNSSEIASLRDVLLPGGEGVILGSGAYWSLRQFEATGIPLAFDPTHFFGMFPWEGGKYALAPGRTGRAGFHDDHPLAHMPTLAVNEYLACRIDDFCRVVQGVRELMMNVATIEGIAAAGFALGEHLASRGIELAAWTLKDEGAAVSGPLMSRLFDAGVTTIITDAPLVLAAYLAGS